MKQKYDNELYKFIYLFFFLITIPILEISCFQHSELVITIAITSRGGKGIKMLKAQSQDNHVWPDGRSAMFIAFSFACFEEEALIVAA